MIDIQVLVLEPSKVLMPSYVAINKNANEEGEVEPHMLFIIFTCDLSLFTVVSVYCYDYGSRCDTSLIQRSNRLMSPFNDNNPGELTPEGG